MGRINYGPLLRDKKGLFGVHFGNQHHFGWDNYPLPMDNLDVLEYKLVGEGEIAGPTFLRGYLDIEGEPADTFVRLDGFKKGFVVVNGFNIGRYFNLAGPQRTLYIPAPMLKTGRNEIVVFESDGTDALEIELFDKPDLG
jgi:beta-galactosidase